MELFNKERKRIQISLVH